MDAKNINLFPPRSSKHYSRLLTKKESAILRLADAYGISRIAAAKLILGLRKRHEAANVKLGKNTTSNELSLWGR